MQTWKSTLKRDKNWKRTQSEIQPSWNKSSLLFQTRVELYVYFGGHSLWCCWTVLEVSPSSFSQSVQYNATQSEFGSRDLQLTNMLEMEEFLYNQIKVINNIDTVYDLQYLRKLKAIVVFCREEAGLLLDGGNKVKSSWNNSSL